MPSPRRAGLLAASLLCVLLGACKNDEITSYRVEKRPAPSFEMGQELPAGHPPIEMGRQLPPGHPPIGGSGVMSSMPSGMAGTAASQGEVSWTLPGGWKEKPLSEMRVGSFRVPGEGGLEADVSIVVLGGDAGGDLANINRWRGQLNLRPIQDLAGQAENVAPGGRAMLLVDLVTPDLFIDNRYRKRLIAAIYPRGGRTWFFKMTGEDRLVAKAKPAFLRFLGGLRFHDEPGS